MAKLMHFTGVAAVVALAVASAGCGELAGQAGRSPSQVVILNLQGAPGAQPELFGGTLNSDVETVVEGVPTIFNDLGQVTMTLVLKDQGQAGVTASPSPLNQVTFNRYRVVYRRTDGRNVQGVDVPFAFDSATTFTVPVGLSVTQGFELVRHVAKLEAPLRALRTSGVVISTIAEVSFYGRDVAGNEVAATGNIGIAFGNFGDPN